MFLLWSQFKSVRQSNNNPKIGSYSGRCLFWGLQCPGLCGSSHTDITPFTYHPKHWLLETRNLKRREIFIASHKHTSVSLGLLTFMCYLLWFGSVWFEHEKIFQVPSMGKRNQVCYTSSHATTAGWAGWTGLVLLAKKKAGGMEPYSRNDAINRSWVGISISSIIANSYINAM